MNLSTFRTAFPEFKTAPDDLLNAWLTLAANEVDPGVFGGSFDLAHGYKTALLLAASPFGKNARLVSNENRSTYEKLFNELRTKATAGLGRVIL